MARKPMTKELINSRLLKEYASWIYCTECNKTVAYLCYVTYDSFTFNYDCQCGSKGSIRIEFEHAPMEQSKQPLELVNNRLCCPKDKSPLVTFVDKNVKGYSYSIGCKECQTEYTGKAGAKT